MSHLPVGTLLNGGKFKIVRFLSQGGFGCTYEVVHQQLGDHYAIKEFFVADFCNRDDATHRVTLATESKRQLIEKLKRKFLDEAQFVSKFRHPNIVRVTDIFEENNTSYFVMDFINGRSVAEMVGRDGAIPEARAVDIILQICDALEYVHNRNRLHLDIKPGNIMVDNNGHATLIDFGVSKQYDEVGGENTSTLMGFSKGYAPAEQLSSEVTKFLPATDIYALGATLYKMLSGETPPNSSRLATGDPLPPLPVKISKPVKEAVYAAMNPMKLRRPQSIAEFRALLTQQAADVPVHVANDTSGKTEIIPEKKQQEIKSDNPPKRPTYEPPIVKKKKTGMFVGIGAAFLAAAAIFILLLGSKSDKVEDAYPQIPESPEVAAATEVVYDEPAEEGFSIEGEEYFSSNVSKSYNSNISSRPIYTYTVNGINFNMIPVDGGTFQMGATSEQQNSGLKIWDDESPVHSVSLSDYWIGETEVTQELWQAVMGNNPSNFKGSKRPVEKVSWHDCQTFLRTLNGLIEESGYKFRLPTEAEWEYAARGGRKSKGYVFSGSDSERLVAWCDGNSGGSTHDVKSLRPNELGIYDMSGNIWEWCSDWYGDYSSGSQSNPIGPDSGSCRVCRGGSWISPPTGCRVAYRGSDDPSDTDYYLGLRLALSSYR